LFVILLSDRCRIAEQDTSISSKSQVVFVLGIVPAALSAQVQSRSDYVSERKLCQRQSQPCSPWCYPVK